MTQREKKRNTKKQTKRHKKLNYQAVLRGALRQQTAFTLVLLAMERLTMAYDDDDDNDHHDAGTSDKSTLRRVSRSSHPPSVFYIQVRIVVFYSGQVHRAF